jgi:hypothetical protein
VFGGRRQPLGGSPRSSRYVVQPLYADINAKKGYERSGRAVEDALNNGDDKGWELVSMYNIGSSFLLLIVWDTEPERMGG